MQTHLVVLALLLAPAMVPTRVQLKGIVRDDTGAPVKEATVLIFTAQPRKGVSSICPSCYLDCGRRATTDAVGRFAFDQVDGTRLFQLGAATPTHEAAFAERIDPVGGTAQITLHRRQPLPNTPRRIVRARLVDMAGDAVPHAVISPVGYRTGWSFSFGPGGTPAVTITDAQGAFTLVAGVETDAVILTASSSGLATTAFEVPTGATGQKLSIGRGSAVKGRVTRQCQPLAGVTLGIMQTNRAVNTFVGERTAVTNAEGRFVLTNVVPRQETLLYMKLHDSGAHGTVPTRRVPTSDHEGVMDVGDLAVEAGGRLTGRVVLDQGASVPSDSTLTISRDNVLDSTAVAIDGDGTFAIDGVPNEPLTLITGVPGYRLSSKNPGVRPEFSSMPLAPFDLYRDVTLFLEREIGPR